jgi:1-acyl-sn-glycerol-3-phosphate acyltransferase
VRVDEEGTLRIWLRRLISIPICFLATALAIGLAPLGLPLLLLLDLLRPLAGRFARLRAGLFFCVYLLCESIGVLGALAVWVASGATLLVSRRRWVEWNTALQRVWSGALGGAAFRIYGARASVVGADRVLPAPFILLVRHTSTADTILAANLVANPHRVLLRYVLKRQLLWDPCLDVVGRRLPNAFVERSGADTRGDLAAVRALAADLRPEEGVLIYPEGTRFSEAKLARAREKVTASGDEQLAALAAKMQRVLPPQLGGMSALLDALTDVDLVILAQQGFEGVASFNDFWGGRLVGRTVRVRFTRIPSTEIPADPKERAHWLFRTWLEVDRWIASAAREDAE